MADEIAADLTVAETTAPEATTEAPAADVAVESTLLGSDVAAEAAPEAAEPEAPTAPETYELTAPEGQSLDADALGKVEPVFRELGLSNDQAQKLVDAYADLVPQIATKAIEDANQRVMTDVVAQRKAWADEARADAEIGGAKFDENMGKAAKALDALGFEKGHPFRNLLNDSGLGNHPDMIRAWVRIASAISEDSDFVRSDTGAPIEQNPARLLYPNNPPKEA